MYIKEYVIEVYSSQCVNLIFPLNDTKNNFFLLGLTTSVLIVKWSFYCVKAS